MPETDYIKKETKEKKEIDSESVNSSENPGDTTCPLLPKDWIMFLSHEIYNLEYEKYRVVSSIYPTAAILAAFGTGIISWMLAVPQFLLPLNKFDILNIISFFSKLIGNIVIILFAIAIYGYLSFYRPIVKKIEKLKLFRQKIILGQLSDSDEIRDEWQKAAAEKPKWKIMRSISK